MKAQLITQLLSLESSGLNSLEHTPDDWQQAREELEQMPAEHIEELIKQFEQ